VRTFPTLEERYPALGERLAREPLADLPTPVRRVCLSRGSSSSSCWIKQDDLSCASYGGNKVRKLEYLFGRIDRNRFERVATYGTVASNHALATAIHARRLGLAPICFLAHQTRTPLARAALRVHLGLGSELVAWHGDYAHRIEIQRRALRGRRASVIPMGGSSWSGCVGFVNAGLELGAQVDAGELDSPSRIYLASGTMGTAAGLALGLALAGMTTELHAVRVSHSSIANDAVLARLMRKTVAMLQRLDPGFPADLDRKTRVVIRHDYFEPGYARSTAAVDKAIVTARDQADLELEATYTGKAMCALLDDLPGCAARGERLLFWQTWSGLPRNQESGETPERGALPEEFGRYFD